MLIRQQHLGYLLLFLPTSRPRLTHHERFVYAECFLTHIIFHLAIRWTRHSLLWQHQVYCLWRCPICCSRHDFARSLPPPRCSCGISCDVPGLHGYRYWYLGHLCSTRHHGLCHPPRNRRRCRALGYVWIHRICHWSDHCRFSMDQYLAQEIG